MWYDDENFVVKKDSLTNLFSDISSDKFFRVKKPIRNVFHPPSGKVTIGTGSVLRIDENNDMFVIYTVDGSKTINEFKTLLSPKIIERTLGGEYNEPDEIVRNSWGVPIYMTEKIQLKFEQI